MVTWLDICPSMKEHLFAALLKEAKIVNFYLDLGYSGYHKKLIQYC